MMNLPMSVNRSFIAAALMLVPMVEVAADPPAMTLMTFNIRYDNPADGPNAWPHRKDLVLKTIAAYEPAVLAVQEALPHQLAALVARFPEYKQVGQSRRGDGEGEFSGLLIDVGQLEVLDSGQIWLSQTPEEVGSVGWDAALTRTATWAMLRTWGSSGPAFLIVGTHFDHQGEEARNRSAELIVSSLDTWCDQKKLPVIIMGDLNAGPESECLDVFREAGFAPLVDAGQGTFHRFSGHSSGPQIDYILRNARWHVIGAQIVRARSGERCASDHDPVAARVRPFAARGTIDRPRQLTETWQPPEHTLIDLPSLSLPEEILMHAQRISDVLADRGVSETDSHQLSRVRGAFDHPFALPELGLEMTDRVRTLASDPAGIQALVGDMLNADPTNGERIRGDAELAEQVLALLEVPAETFYIEEDSLPLLDVINRSMDVDFGAIVASIAVPEMKTQPWFGRAKPPGVTGRILAGQHGPNGWQVVGGEGPNTYDMNLVSEVFDVGGDDRYTASDLVLGDRLVVDLGGNDIYSGTDRQGPAAGLFGTWIIDDRAGDDRYGQEGGRFSTGAGAFGVGMIIDRGGDDTYMGTHWSIGAAIYGAGIIMDLGGGSDHYLGDYLTDAVGGPRGFGFVFDEAGDDHHMADGPTPSIYETPDVHASFSQGMGFGYRKYAAGGIGMLCDLSGNDEYRAGEFSQGGAYYHSLGVLRDFGGDDVYHGNRYAQGFGVHQAFGVLIEDAGDDVYTAMTAADQGSAWDIAAGALLERSGNDSYTANGMAQGSAAQQAIAYLIDCGGNDIYTASNPGQGGSGNNTYHWDATKAFSFSLLLDLGGVDTYSLGRGHDETTVIDPAPEPGGVGVGVCVDVGSVTTAPAPSTMP
jgi:endonuclease/exonuclease/phosphatase family metal-dependent hydrolase